MTRLDLDRFIAKHANDQVKALTGSDRKRLEDTVEFLYRHSEKVNLAALELRTEGQREYVTKRFGVKAVPAPVRSGLTLMGAYEQAWLHHRSCRGQRISAIRQDRISDRAEVPEPHRSRSENPKMEAGLASP
jgi:hypothetical protein